MWMLETSLLAVTLSGLLLGGMSIVWARGEERHHRTRWGRRLFVVTLLLLGGIGLVGAALRAHGLPPLGLAAGLLVVAMLWESPHAEFESGGDR